MTTRTPTPDGPGWPCPACGVTDLCLGCGGCECDCTCWNEAAWHQYGPAITVPLAVPGAEGGHQ
jgi:hypothetical protein